MQSETATAPRVLVLGIGNTLMSDDGVGGKVVERLQNGYSFPENVALLDGGTLGLELLSELEGISHLIIVDAVESGAPPGSVSRVTGEELPMLLETKLSPHQLGLKDLLAVARLAGDLPPELVLLGVQPAEIKLGLELTPKVAAQLPALGDKVLQELERIGVHADPL